MDFPPVRFAEGSDDVVEGLAIPFGGPFRGGTDLYRTRFDTADLCLDWYPVRPVLFHHGQDPEVRASVIGMVKTSDITDYDDGTRKGKWIRAQLDKRHEYFDAIRDLVREGSLGWSHGTMDYLVVADPPARDGTRNITQWPVAEFTLTPVEANPDAFAVAHTMRSADAETVLRLLGTSEAEIAVRGWLPEGTSQTDLDDGDFAWLATDATLPDSERRKLPYKLHGKVNEAGWRAAWSRANQDGTDFSGGPSRADVRTKLLADKPADIEVADSARSASAGGAQFFQAAAGARIVADILELLSAECDEPDQAAMLQAAVDSVTDWIAAERAETTDDGPNYIDMPMMMSAPFRAGARNSAADQVHIDAIHSHAVALGASAHQESDDDTPEPDGKASADESPSEDDASPARSAELGPVVLTVMGDADMAVRAAALAKAEEVGRSKALSLRT